jgi:hypothetical protein
MISASKNTYGLENLKIVRSKVTKNVQLDLRHFLNIEAVVTIAMQKLEVFKNSICSGKNLKSLNVRYERKLILCII